MKVRGRVIKKNAESTDIYAYYEKTGALVHILVDENQRETRNILVRFSLCDRILENHLAEKAVEFLTKEPL